MSVLHKGFSFIEIIIALLLSTLLLGVVLQITYRVTSQERFAKKNLEKDLKIMMLHMQLVKDISGICAVMYEEKQEHGSKEKTSAVPTIAQGIPVQSSSNKDNQERYFYSINKDNHVDFFTFVTTNSLTFYGQESKPLVRVVYRLSQEKERQTFMLLRQELSVLGFEDIEKASTSPAVLLDGIIKFEINYFYVKPTEKSQEKVEKSKESELEELVTVSEWGKAQDSDKDKKEEVPKIPRYIAIKFECDNGMQKELWYEIPFVFESLPDLPRTKTEKNPGMQTQALPAVNS